MEKILSKKVSLIELFYDLIFAYMISCATELLHHLEHGIVSINSIVIFALVVIVFINSWMVQTVFTNRYGESSWTDIIFYFLSMIILLYMTNSFETTNINHLGTFFIAAGLLSLLLMLQYLITFIKSKNAADKKISQIFALILGFRTVMLLIGGLLNNQTGSYIAIIGTIISWILPGFTSKYTKDHPIIFSHLLERLTLLIIITFGETIINIADYFKPETFSAISIIVFLIVAGLFFSYIVEFDHLIDKKQVNATGNKLIYLHYFILFGLSWVTVAFKYFNENNSNYTFSVACLYFGFLLIYIGIFSARKYNKENGQYSIKFISSILCLLLLGYLITFIISKPLMLVMTLLIIFIITGSLVNKIYTK